MKKKLGLECIECSELMPGVHDYVIRTTCEPCGGKSLVDYQKNPPIIEKEEAA